MNKQLTDNQWWRKLGEHGENRVTKYLVEKGYNIWHRNWKCWAGELDIVASIGDVLAFIEVRTRVYKKESDIRARDSIGVEKQARLIRLIDIYIDSNEQAIRDHRITTFRRDVAGVEYHTGKSVIIDHIEDAF